MESVEEKCGEKGGGGGGNYGKMNGGVREQAGQKRKERGWE